MLQEPSVYPEETILKQIGEEDFAVYIPVASGKVSGENRVSYGQLSALVALASKKY